MASDRGIVGWLALGLLLDHPASGYDLWLRAERSVAHFWPVTRSALYAELPRLEQRGLTTSTQILQHGYPNKRIYEVTSQGREMFVDWLTTANLAERPRHPQQLMLFFAAHAPAEHSAQLLATWRTEAERTYQRCRHILAERGFDPGPGTGETGRSGGIPHDPRLLTALFGLRRSRADLTFLDEITPAFTSRPDTKESTHSVPDHH